MSTFVLVGVELITAKGLYPPVVVDVFMPLRRKSNLEFALLLAGVAMTDLPPFLRVINGTVPASARLLT
ncbi:hypothetical protein N7468_010453 [Penicillium chermesinum]|uniref:Uncharacterized protein n=1 Tax=Penicillium chermesinum TaxID=63820 RepID=A0A9W9TDD0_9EURO|nr:uncharacterized protein N7468_010453 [Penicillium chermesinum]KAJ5217445.1 hypothetical protein N7468_010453 [Penicillium chermesinum]KAJ6170943.1 hypothetical protein N7470_000010 [Penicillium chermesinum]